MDHAWVTDDGEIKFIVMDHAWATKDGEMKFIVMDQDWITEDISQREEERKEE